MIMSGNAEHKLDQEFQLPIRFSEQQSTFVRATKCILNCRIFSILLLLAISVVLLVTTTLLLPPKTGTLGLLLVIVFSILVFSLFCYSLLIIWREFIKPLLDLEIWTQHIRSGELEHKMQVPEYGEMAHIAAEINDLGTMMFHLSRDTDQQLQLFTQYNEQKTLSLSILYDVAASINVSSDLNDLLGRFLRSLTDVIKARAGAVRLLNASGQMELVASTGFDNELIKKEKFLPAESCICGQTDKIDGFRYQDNLLPCGKLTQHQFFGQDIGLLVVPLQYQGKTLGVYNLFVAKELYRENDDDKELFTSIGRHLGMAIAKARLDQESTQVSIMQERNRLAYELHDSLAQTLTSIRFQVRVLDDILHQDDEKATWHQLERIEGTVDEANTELRGLIAHFQAPIRKQALINAVQEMVKRFRTDSEIHIFFQHTINRPLTLDDKTHLEVVRILQEALNNIRKHSEANVARIMIKSVDEEKIQILIEDDGIGLKQQKEKIRPGEQIGLKSMKQRASRLKAELLLESEPGEGTRLILTFKLPAQTSADSITIDNNFNLTQ